MKFYRLVPVTIALIFSTNINASLIDRGNGLIYDTELDITWLSNTHITETLDVGGSYGTVIAGKMSWQDANTYINQMNIFEVNGYMGFNGWRLPSSLQPDANCSIQDNYGSWGTNCIGSELGHLFYHDLGGVAGESILDDTNPDPDLALFDFRNRYSSDQYLTFWTSELIPSSDPRFSPIYAMRFGLWDSEQRPTHVNGPHDVWIVHDGDIGAVPVPAALWLFSSGLIGLIFVAKRRTVNT